MALCAAGRRRPRHRPAAANLAAPSAQLIEKGRYLATAGDCIACHTAKGGKPFAGGLPMASPIGTLYSSNITPDKATGIGSYSAERLRPRGAPRHPQIRRTLYPAMPYPSYAKISDQDMRALYAYFMHGVAPVMPDNRGNDDLVAAVDQLAAGDLAQDFAPGGAPGAFDAKYQSEALARGAYLVQGLGHCGSLSHAACARRCRSWRWTNRGEASSRAVR
jgi:mono/diheme cytochrome c family protein